jgi:hypothetical protein
VRRRPGEDKTDLDELRERQRTLADRARLARLRDQAAEEPKPTAPPAPRGPIRTTLRNALLRGWAARLGDRLACMACFRLGRDDAVVALPGGAQACRGGHLEIHGDGGPGAPPEGPVGVS